MIGYKNAYFEVKASYACPRFNIPFFYNESSCEVWIEIRQLDAHSWS